VRPWDGWHLPIDPDRSRYAFRLCVQIFVGRLLHELVEVHCDDSLPELIMNSKLLNASISIPIREFLVDFPFPVQISQKSFMLYFSDVMMVSEQSWYFYRIPCSVCQREEEFSMKDEPATCDRHLPQHVNRSSAIMIKLIQKVQ
jgi:hypothetical protein